jgi:dolichol kinase
MYYYFFYKLYKITLTGRIKSLAGWWAGALINGLGASLLLSYYNYYAVFVDRNAELKLLSAKVLIPVAVLLIINHIAFDKTAVWKAYVEEFDRWPRKKNQKGSWIVGIIISLIILNLIFSYFLLFLNSPYTGSDAGQ